MTVTGEAPLIDTQSSVLAGNIDPKQMQDLPINGRNWMDLAMLAPGSRQNQSSGVPLLRQGYSQINIDGQQVTNNYIGIGDDQPRYSRDSIAEFEVITNRFDATQGRSAGMIANAITKSGTNRLLGRHRRLLPRREAQRGRQGAERRAAVPEPAGQHDVRRTARQGPRPFLRQLRVRARAAGARLRGHRRARGVQHEHPGAAHAVHLGVEGRRPVLAEEPVVAARQRLRPGIPVRWRSDRASVNGARRTSGSPSRSRVSGRPC